MPRATTLTYASMPGFEVGSRAAPPAPQRADDPTLRRDPALRGAPCTRPGRAELAGRHRLRARRITDQLDGWLARRWHVESGFGKVADPLADRLMIDVCVVLLVVYDRLPWIALVILLRDLLLVGGYKLVVPRGYEVRGLASREDRDLGAVLARARPRPPSAARGGRRALLGEPRVGRGRRRASRCEGNAGGSEMKAVVMAGGEGTRLRP